LISHFTSGEERKGVCDATQLLGMIPKDRCLKEK